MLSALRSSRGASRMLVLAAWEGAIVALVSVPMILEYEAVLKRADNLGATRLSADDVDRFLDRWAALAKPVVAYYSHRPSVSDADDEIFVEAALNGAADLLVTFNVRDYRPAGGGHRTLAVEVCRPGEALRRLTWRPAATTLSAFRLRS